MAHDLKVDNNQADIVDALRAVGASVLHLQGLEEGAPDILVGYRGVSFLMELKMDTGRVSKAQKQWHERWRGLRVAVVRSADESLRVIGAVK